MRFYCPKRLFFLRYIWLALGIVGVFIHLACSNNKPERVNQKTTSHPVKQASFELDKKTKGKIHRLDSLFDELYQSGQLNGSVLIAHEGHIIFQRTEGWANKEKMTRLNDSSLYQLASVSKTITAAALLKLFQQKKIPLETPVNLILPSFPYKDITVEHLICHRSGLPNYLYFCTKYYQNSVPDYSKFNHNHVLNIMQTYHPATYAKPGKYFNYNNTNYVLLACIIEKLSGSDFKTYVRNEIFKPAGMNHTYFLTELDSVPEQGISVGYTAGMRSVGFDFFDGVYGDKGVYSCTKDMYLFAEYYFSNKIFMDDGILSEALKPHSPEKKQGNYGYGWRMKDFNNANKIIYHNGWWHGYRTAFQYRPKDRTVIVILSNRLNSCVYHTSRIFSALDGGGSKNEAAEDEL